MSTNIKQTKKFKTLVAVLGSEDAALAAYGAAEAKPVEVSPLQQLMDAGFTKEQAERALASQAPANDTPAPLTSKEKGEALVAKSGLTFTKGRVYAGPALAEAIVRVHKNGKPEIVTSSGVGRTKGVLVYKEDSGDVACQNLAEQA